MSEEKVSVTLRPLPKVEKDYPGDADFRDSWAQAIKDINPSGIVYMIISPLVTDTYGMMIVRPKKRRSRLNPTVAYPFF